MQKVSEFLKNKDFSNPDDIDAFLELADYVRELMDEGKYDELGELVKQILEGKYFEAFVWISSILQEKRDNDKNGVKDFTCDLGKSIDDYDAFTTALEIGSEPYATGIKTITDKEGEIKSFYNIAILKTGHPGTYLCTMENFDTRDNDFILYKLLFTDDIDKYIRKLEGSDPHFKEKSDEEDLLEL